MKAKEGANVAATQTLLEKKLALLNDAKQRARRDVAAAFENSNLKDHVRDYPQFDKSELTLGKFLGKGGFGSVYEVLAFEDGSAHPVRGRREEEDEEVEGVESRRFMAEHGIRNDGDCRYAVRFLKPDVIKDPERFYLGMMDMAVLTKFLSSVDHPNIIKLRATAKCDIYSADYFLVLDALYGTLDKRIRKWSVSKERFSGMMGKYITDKKGKKAQDLWKERLAVAYDVSKALAYLHEQNIIFRDLKSENVGFDIHSTVKLFDFGLAKEIHPENRDENGLYKLTAMTGSLQYMAPEVAMDLPYNAACDVYSFSVLLWEILALKRPYENYAPSVMPSKVWSGPHKRPLLDKSWPPEIQSLLTKGWHRDISERFAMKDLAESVLNENSES